MATGDEEDDWFEKTTGVTEEDVERMKLESSLHPGETAADMAKRLFEENAPRAVVEIVNIGQECPNPRLRLDANKYIVDRVLGRVGDLSSTNQETPLTKIVKDMQEKAEKAANGG